MGRLEQMFDEEVLVELRKTFDRADVGALCRYLVSQRICSTVCDSDAICNRIAQMAPGRSTQKRPAACLRHTWHPGVRLLI